MELKHRKLTGIYSDIQNYTLTKLFIIVNYYFCFAILGFDN